MDYEWSMHLCALHINMYICHHRCQGNIILELKSDDTTASATPAQLLLDAAQTINLRRQPPPTLLIQLRDSLSNTLTTKRILSSDLARGHVAVEVSSGGDLREGTQVQFAVRIEGAYDEDDDDAAVMDFGGKTLTGASVLVGNLHDLTTMSSAASANASSSDASSVLEDAPLLISTESGFITSTPVKHHGHGDGSAGTTTFLTDVQTVGGAYVVSETV